MKHIKVIATNTICKDKGTGCGECQTCEQKKTNRPEAKEEK